MEATLSVHQQVNDKDVACVCMYIYIYIQWNISHKKDWSSAICNNVDGPKEYQADRSKSEKDKYWMLSENSIWKYKVV